MARREELLTAVISVDRKGWTQGMRKASKEVGELEQKTDRASKGMVSGFGRATKALAGLAAGFLAFRGLGNVIGGAAKRFGEIDQKLSIVNVKLGATKKEAAELAEVVKQVGIETSKTGQESAEALDIMATAGLTARQSIDSLASVVKFAEATGHDMADSVKIAAGAMNVFNLDAEGMTQTLDAIAAASNSSATNVTELGYALENSQSAWAATGDSVENLLVALGLLAKYGKTGQKAGTQLARAVAEIANPRNAKAEVLLEQLGVTAFDAAGKALPATEMLRSLIVALADATDAQRSQILSTIFGGDAMKAIVPLVKGGVEAWDNMSEAQKEAAGVSELSEARMDTLAGQLDFLSGTVKTVLEGAFKPFAETTKNIVTALADWVSMVAEYVQPGIEQFAASVGTWWERMHAMIEQLRSSREALLYWNMVVVTLKFTVQALRNAITNIIATWQALPEPVKKAVITFAALALGAKLVMGSVMGLVGSLKFIISAVGFMVGPIMKLLGVFWKLKYAFIGGAKLIKYSFLGLKFAVVGVVKVIAAIIGVLSLKVLLIVGAIVGGLYILYRAWKGNFLGIQDIVKAFMQNITNRFNFMETIVQWVKDRLQRFKEIWGEMTEGIRTIVDAWKLGLFKGFMDLANRILEVIGSFAWKMISGWRGWMTTVGRALDGFMTRVRNAWVGFANGVLGIWNDAVAKIANVWDRFATSRVGRALGLGITSGAGASLKVSLISDRGPITRVADAITGMFDAGDRWSAQVDNNIKLLGNVVKLAKQTTDEVPEKLAEQLKWGQVADVAVGDVAPLDEIPTPSGISLPTEDDEEEDEEEEDEEGKKKKKKKSSRRGYGTGRGGTGDGTGKMITVNNTFYIEMVEGDADEVAEKVGEAAHLAFQKLQVAC